MITLDSTTRNLIDAKTRQVVRITVGTGNTSFILSQSDIAQGGLSIDRYCVSGGSYELGSAISAELSLKVLNYEGDFDDTVFEGKEMFVEQGVIDSNDTTHWIPMGYFTVTTPPRKKSTITLTALDRMTRFDEEAMAWCATQTYPMTVAEMVQGVCTRCYVTLDTILSTLPNYNVQVTASPAQEDTTLRNIIQWASALMGCCAFIDWNGHLIFSQGANTDINITPEERYQGADLYEGNVTVTGYTFSTTITHETEEEISSEDVTYVAGTLDYAIELAPNPFMNADNAQGILNNIYNSIGQITYRPFTCTTIPLPYIMPLDKIVYTDPQGNQISTIVTNVVHNLNNGSAIASKGETSTTKSYQSGSGFTPTQSKELTKAQILIEAASTAAISAQQSADEAQASATSAYNSAVSANASASSALTQLSIVEDVAGTLHWISEHGSYTQTTDTTVHPGTVYFIYQNGDYVPIAQPDPTANPSTEGWYVLDVTDSQSEYLMAHLAVTNAGLWVLPVNGLAPHPLVDSDDNQIVDSDDNPIVDFSQDPQNADGYKVLLANDGMTVYNNSGVAVANYGSTTTVGAVSGYNVHIDGTAVKIRNGTTVLASYGATTKFFESDGVTEAAEIGSSGLVLKHGVIQLGNKTSASDTTHTGFYVDGNGNVACSNLLAHGGNIGGWRIANGYLYSYANNSGTVSSQSDALGYIYIQATPGTNRGNSAIAIQGRSSTSDSWAYQFYLRHDGYLYAYNANIRGTITATGGTIGGFTLSSSELDAYGTASGAGTSSNGLYRVLVNAAPGTNGGNVAFGVASRISTSASWTWNTYMNHNGYFYARNANIQGTITSSSGTIGGWTISSNGMFYPNATTPNAWITSSSATFGNGNYNVTTGSIPGPSSSAFYGIEGEPDHALTIGNGVTWLQLGCNGEWLRPNDSGTCSLGNSDYKWTRVYATNGTIQTSDRKDKDVLGNLDEELATNLILNANPITYMWKDGDHRRTRMGFIAQEIAEECKAMNKNLALCTASFKGDPAFSDSGSDIARDYFGEDVDDSELTWGLAYTELIAPLVKVVQMQHNNIQILTSRISELEEAIHG